MKKLLLCLLLVSTFCAAELPDAPSVKAENRAFWITNGLNAASIYADMAVSIKSDFKPGVGSCYETNRVYGSKYPSAQRFLIQGTVEVAAVAVVTYFLKKHHQDWFVVIPLGNVVIHTVATVNTAHYCF